MNGRSLLVTGLVFLGVGHGAIAEAGPCDEFQAEAEAFSGAVPHFNDDGSLRSLSLYADASFLAPKRSLVAKARQKAELRAKRAFAEWMKQDLQSETLVTDMMEQVEKTNADGTTLGSVTEVSQQIDIIRTNAQAVLSGVTKIDECMDPDQKVVIVQMGWKPAFSAAAASAKEAAATGGEGGESGPTLEPVKTKVAPAEGYRVRSSLKDDF